MMPDNFANNGATPSVPAIVHAAPARKKVAVRLHVLPSRLPLILTPPIFTCEWKFAKHRRCAQNLEGFSPLTKARLLSEAIRPKHASTEIAPSWSSERALND
jgi:hypothetical protein